MLWTDTMPSRQYEALFLFDNKHRVFIKDNERLPVIVKPSYGLRYFSAIFFAIALPIVVIITLLVQFAGYDIWLLLPVELITAAALSAYFAFKSYWRWRGLSSNGQILYGEIIHSDTLPAVNGMMTNNTINRIYYEFTTPDRENVIHNVDLNYQGERLPDGRKYPDIGTRIAILYAGKNNHVLL